ncbi:glycosyltransferase family 4 protein [Leptolyngbya sp. FACHB-261]|uniref:glycosyltransferase family 4 protein n=1 Tax=Leptolyngbya sp. FACHB-261 TaxID=2692806 RepID=UPI0016836913|nr:glycosyltransferase [Leptolyngbya sp. FACHB-261]MBD2099622.1 glycosyltransferase [Leptolyngbya sp. FACHB-261]
MRILIALPTVHPELTAVNGIVDGTIPCSGTIGSIVRLASLLTSSGVDVSLSVASEVPHSDTIVCIQHKQVDATQYDHLIVHQSHWNNTSITFGNQALAKTVLWLQNQTSWNFIHSFLQKGGAKIVVPSMYHANIYRALKGWQDKIAVIYNSYCSVFSPVEAQTQRKLLFIGAITPTKGFTEVMQVWSYLVRQKVDLRLAIAGNIGIHRGSAAVVGPLGIAELNFETEKIQPWLNALSESYQPQFLGALPPIQLHEEIAQSWAVMVNPSWNSLETFCVAAVEAQACERTVFSVAAGGLKETVYAKVFGSLTSQRSIESLGDCILNGLSNIDAVEQNGRSAREYVSKRFNQQTICQDWLNLLTGKKVEQRLPNHWSSSRDFLCDLMRWSRAGEIVGRIR